MPHMDCTCPVCDEHLDIESPADYQTHAMETHPAHGAVVIVGRDDVEIKPYGVEGPWYTPPRSTSPVAWVGILALLAYPLLEWLLNR